MSNAMNGWFELIEVLVVIGLFMIMAPMLSIYWTQSIVTYADDKTALDTRGTIAVTDEGESVVEYSTTDLLLLCYVMGENLNEGRNVKVNVNGSTISLMPDESSSWETDKVTLLKSVWSKAYNYKKSAALDLQFIAEYIPSKTTITNGTTTGSSEGYWYFTVSD